MLPSIARLANKHGIIPLKKFGQNFIYDESLCDKIVKFSVININAEVLEIGPGPAGLTRSILKVNPNLLTVIETDPRCLPLLEEIKDFYPNLNIKLDDALKVPLSAISSNKIDIIANLPYNIGTLLLTNWLSQIDHVRSMTLMLQKEVVDRIVSSPNSKSYGRLSIICQIFCHVEKCFDVSPKAFYPEPKIWSSVVRLVPKNSTPPDNVRDALEKITQAAFSGRRKMIRSSLGKVIPNIESVLNDLDIKPTLRAENLAPDDYVRLTSYIVN